MKYRQEFERIMLASSAMALATAVNGIPNVRIVNFCYDLNRPGVIYFATDPTNTKVAEFEQNPYVALMTIPDDAAGTNVRSHRAKVQRSTATLEQMTELFLTQIPGFAEPLSVLGEVLEVFEIHLAEAVVTLGYDETSVVNFN